MKKSIILREIEGKCREIKTKSRKSENRKS